MILPGSLIPWDKYFLKNLTFVVRISTRVATSPFQSNSVRGQGEEQTTKKAVSFLAYRTGSHDEVRGSRHDFPSGRPGRTLLFFFLKVRFLGRFRPLVQLLGAQVFGTKSLEFDSRAGLIGTASLAAAATLLVLPSS